MLRRYNGAEIKSCVDNNNLSFKAAVDPKSFLPGRAADSINIVHFNDVTNEPTTAAGLFMTELANTKDDNPLILFSGNAISPCMSMTHFNI